MTLYNDAEGHKWIPAPEYYWKVVQIPSSGDAVAFIGVNNPHEAVAPEPLCATVTSETRSLKEQ